MGWVIICLPLKLALWSAPFSPYGRGSLVRERRSVNIHLGTIRFVSNASVLFVRTYPSKGTFAALEHAGHDKYNSISTLLTNHLLFVSHSNVATFLEDSVAATKKGSLRCEIVIHFFCLSLSLLSSNNAQCLFSYCMHACTKPE